MAIPIMLGLIAIGKDFAIIFLGEDFEKSGLLIQLLAITVVFMTIANVIRTQYLIPNNRDKEYIIAIIAGAIVNLILNCTLIKPYGALGASIGIVLAEFTVMLLHVWFANKQIPIVKKILKNKDIFFKGIIMFIVVYLIGKINMNIYIKVVMQIGVGVIIYGILNYRYIKENINIKKIIKKEVA